MTTRYTVENGKLVIHDLITNKLLWSGDFDGCPVLKILFLPNENDCLLLLDAAFSKQPTFKNLLRVQANGEIVWRAQMLRSHDSYTDILLTHNGIEAWTWCGFHVLVSPLNGTTKEIGFSK